MKSLTKSVLLKLKKEELVDKLLASEDAVSLEGLKVQVDKLEKEVSRKENVINAANKEKAELHQQVTELKNKVSAMDGNLAIEKKKARQAVEETTVINKELNNLKNNYSALVEELTKNHKKAVVYVVIAFIAGILIGLAF